MIFPVQALFFSMKFDLNGPSLSEASMERVRGSYKVIVLGVTQTLDPRAR